MHLTSSSSRPSATPGSTASTRTAVDERGTSAGAIHPHWILTSSVSHAASTTCARDCRCPAREDAGWYRYSGFPVRRTAGTQNPVLVCECAAGDLNGPGSRVRVARHQHFPLLAFLMWLPAGADGATCHVPAEVVTSDAAEAVWAPNSTGVNARAAQTARGRRYAAAAGGPKSRPFWLRGNRDRVDQHDHHARSIAVTPPSGVRRRRCGHGCRRRPVVSGPRTVLERTPTALGPGPDPWRRGFPRCRTGPWPARTCRRP